MEEAEKNFPPGAVVEGTVSNLTKFGAFIELAPGLEGMIHIGDISSEKRLNHPREALEPGKKVRALVLETDRAKRRIRLGMKQWCQLRRMSTSASAGSASWSPAASSKSPAPPPGWSWAKASWPAASSKRPRQASLKRPAAPPI